MENHKTDYELIIMICLLMFISVIDKSNSIELRNIKIHEIVQATQMIESSESAHSRVKEVTLGIVYIGISPIPPPRDHELYLVPSKYSPENRLQYLDGDIRYNIYAKNTELRGKSNSRIEPGYYRYYTMLSTEDKKLLILIDRLDSRQVKNANLSVPITEIQNYTDLKIVVVSE